MRLHGRRLNHMIEIQQKKSIRDEIGGEKEEWELFSRAWAEVKPISGREFFSSNAIQNTVSHRVIVRYIDGILPSMQLLHKDRIFKIHAVRDYFERERWIEIMCEELI